MVSDLQTQGDNWYQKGKKIFVLQTKILSIYKKRRKNVVEKKGTLN
jgi:hypothetical protein